MAAIEEAKRRSSDAAAPAAEAELNSENALT
jgi:hypothetical protein